MSLLVPRPIQLDRSVKILVCGLVGVNAWDMHPESEPKGRRDFGHADILPVPCLVGLSSPALRRTHRLGGT